MRFVAIIFFLLLVTRAPAFVFFGSPSGSVVAEALTADNIDNANGTNVSLNGAFNGSFAGTFPQTVATGNVIGYLVSGSENTNVNGLYVFYFGYFAPLTASNAIYGSGYSGINASYDPYYGTWAFYVAGTKVFTNSALLSFNQNVMPPGTFVPVPGSGYVSNITVTPFLLLSGTISGAQGPAGTNGATGATGPAGANGTNYTMTAIPVHYSPTYGSYAGDSAQGYEIAMHPGYSPGQSGMFFAAMGSYTGTLRTNFTIKFCVWVTNAALPGIEYDWKFRTNGTASSGVNYAAFTGQTLLVNTNNWISYTNGMPGITNAGQLTSFAFSFYNGSTNTFWINPEQMFLIP